MSSDLQTVRALEDELVLKLMTLSASVATASRLGYTNCPEGSEEYYVDTVRQNIEKMELAVEEYKTVHPNLS